MTTVGGTILTSLVPDPVRHCHSICRRLGVLHRVLEEMLFCICLLRVAGLPKQRLHTQFAFSRHFKYNNDIHATANGKLGLTGQTMLG